MAFLLDAVSGNQSALFGDMLDTFAYPDLRKYDIAILGNQDNFCLIT